VCSRADQPHRGTQREAAEEQQDDSGDGEFGSRGGFQLMKTLTFTLILALACGKISNSDKPLSVPGEKIYTLEGEILDHDHEENALTIEHKAIPGYMEAMTMDYIVRGAKVDTLPPNGTHIIATLHVTQGKGIWITGVRAGDAAHRPPQAPAAQQPAASR
jgi:hypothetical protein